jgi:hypothetical protein
MDTFNNSDRKNSTSGSSKDLDCKLDQPSLVATYTTPKKNSMSHNYQPKKIPKLTSRVTSYDTSYDKLAFSINLLDRINSSTTKIAIISESLKLDTNSDTTISTLFESTDSNEFKEVSKSQDLDCKSKHLSSADEEQCLNTPKTRSRQINYRLKKNPKLRTPILLVTSTHTKRKLFFDTDVSIIIKTTNTVATTTTTTTIVPRLVDTNEIQDPSKSQDLDQELAELSLNKQLSETPKKIARRINQRPHKIMISKRLATTPRSKRRLFSNLLETPKKRGRQINHQPHKNKKSKRLATSPRSKRKDRKSVV